MRKFLFLGEHCLKVLKEDLKNFEKAKRIEFDDLETFEHSNLKPLAALAVVESKSRRILGFNVAQMSLKGKIRKRSIEKYGPRKDERAKARNLLFSELQDFVAPDAVIKSDQNSYYAHSVRRFFPGAKYKTYRSKRARQHGQGELKKGGFDPIFSINHTLAMFRANVNRLVRRTWNTTKKRDRLALHLAIYAVFHNWILIKNQRRAGASIGPLMQAAFL